MSDSVSAESSVPVSQTDWIVVGVGVVILWGLDNLSKQIEDLRERLAPDDDDDEEA